MLEAMHRANARRRLERAFAIADSIDALNFEQKGLATHHLCILLTGVLEESVRLHISEYALLKSHARIANFVSNQIEYLTNLHSEKIETTLRQMDEDVADEVAGFLDDRRRSALNSLMGLRHKIAHGKDGGGTSLNTVKSYRDVVVEILDKLDEIFKRLAA
jgi:hypothetical protein